MKIKIVILMLFSLLFQENFSELKSYINKLEKGDMDVPYETIYSYEKIAPNHPVYLYLRGLIEIDGDKAIEYYKRLYSANPNSEYADNAAMKIGEYYYSKGLYVQAADWLKKMPTYYPRSDRTQDAVDLFLKSLIIAGKRDTAMFYLKIIKNQIPNISIKDEYNSMLKKTGGQSEIPDNIPEVLGQSFYLQIGAYKEYNNARKVRDVLNLKGFNARIKHISLDGARLYSVLEGRYPSFDLAKKSSKQIEKKLDYSSIIKQHN